MPDAFFAIGQVLSIFVLLVGALLAVAEMIDAVRNSDEEERQRH